MTVDKDFSFELNVSTGSFPTAKPSSKYVGKIQYQTQTITLAQMEDYQRQGKSFCYLFRQADEAGLVSQQQKTLDNFEHTQLIFFDIDKMPVQMEEYISPIQCKPSLSYTTYSNGIDGKYGYRLIYAFSTPVSSIEEFDSLYYAIAAANGFRQQVNEQVEKFEFDYRQVNQQYYGGGAGSTSVRTDIVYEVSDFSQYVVQGTELKNKISSSTKSSNRKTVSQSQCSNQNNNKREGEKKAYNSDLNTSFFNDLYSLSPSDFLLSYSEQFHSDYLASISTPLLDSGDERYLLYPDNYYEVFRLWRMDAEGRRSVHRWAVGSGRKNRLYITAQIMVHYLPDISREQLIYNLVCERLTYYNNSDNKLNNDFIVSTADNALKYSFNLAASKHHNFKVNKAYCIENGITPQALSNIIRREMKEAQVFELYDFTKSQKENLRILKENGIKICRTTLSKYLSKYNDKCSTQNNNRERREESILC